MAAMRSHRIILAALLIVSGLMPATIQAAPREYELKAAFVYNFVMFVQWPPNSFTDEKSPILIATIGSDPFDGALERAVAGKTVERRPLVIKHFVNAAELQPCQLLFVASADDEQLAPALRKFAGRSVLTVGESDRFVQGGGIIRFYEQENHLRFEINQEAAAKAGLRISAKLLRLAKPRNG